MKPIILYIAACLTFSSCSKADLYNGPAIEILSPRDSDVFHHGDTIFFDIKVTSKRPLRAVKLAYEAHHSPYSAFPSQTVVDQFENTRQFEYRKAVIAKYDARFSLYKLHVSALGHDGSQYGEIVKYFID